MFENYIKNIILNLKEYYSTEDIDIKVFKYNNDIFFSYYMKSNSLYYTIKYIKLISDFFENNPNYIIKSLDVYTFTKMYFSIYLKINTHDIYETSNRNNIYLSQLNLKRIYRRKDKLDEIFGNQF